MKPAKLTPPAEQIEALRAWYLAEVAALVDRIEPELRSGELAGWSDEGEADGVSADGAQASALCDVCEDLIGEDEALWHLVAALSPSTPYVSWEHLERSDAARIVQRDVVMERRRRGIPDPGPEDDRADPRPLAEVVPLRRSGAPA